METINIFNHIYLRGDQPTTCPKCGARTEIILDMSHTIDQVWIHECLSPYCKKVFVEVEDVEKTIYINE